MPRHRRKGFQHKAGLQQREQGGKSEICKTQVQQCMKDKEKNVRNTDGDKVQHCLQDKEKNMSTSHASVVDGDKEMDAFLQNSYLQGEKSKSQTENDMVDGVGEHDTGLDNSFFKDNASLKGTEYHSESNPPLEGVEYHLESSNRHKNAKNKRTRRRKTNKKFHDDQCSLNINMNYGDLRNDRNVNVSEVSTSLETDPCGKVKHVEAPHAENAYSIGHAPFNISLQKLKSSQENGASGSVYQPESYVEVQMEDDENANDVEDAALLKNSGDIQMHTFYDAPTRAEHNEDKPIEKPSREDNIQGKKVSSPRCIKNLYLILNVGQELGTVSRPMGLEKPLLNTRKKLLVLDLNGLLADILYASNCTHRAYKRISGKSVFKRPFCDEFLNFCFEAFDVGVWSSRKKRNVDAVVDYLMGDRKHELLFCWDQSRCTSTGFRTIEDVHKPMVLKELRKLWNREEPDLPWENGKYSPSNTLLIDDSPYKALCNPPHTAIFPSSYSYLDENDTSLGLGGDIRVYLEGLVMANDVQVYVQQYAFGQHAITEAHPFWKFYQQVIEQFKNHSH